MKNSPLTPPAPAVSALPPALVGTAGAGLLIEQIGAEAEALLHRSVDELIGTSLVAVVAQHDATACLSAISAASSSRSPRSLSIDVRTGDRAETQPCEMLIFPVEPAPHCVFVLIPSNRQGHRTNDPMELSVILRRLGRRVTNGSASRPAVGAMSESQLHGISRLTARELEIVTRLVDGDRVPAIAASLFLGQSTVRNHLASVFAKLGVSSQQQLLDLIRAAATEAPKDS